MKKLLTLLSVVLILASCGQPEADKGEIPQELAAKKALLKEKRAELRELKTFIETLEDSIRAADPNANTTARTLVTTEDIKRKSFTRFVEIQGSVQADNTVKVSSEIGGRLQGFTLEEGDQVKKGQEIGYVDVEQVRRSIAELQTRLTLAEDVYQRQKSLWDQKIGTEIQYIQAKNDVEALKKSINTLEYQLTKEKIYAPTSGIVNMLFAKNGEVLGPGTPIFDILDLNKVKAVADVPEIYIKSIRKGETLKIKFPAIEAERTGRVSLIGNQINPNNRTFKVEIALSNPGKQLLPNLLTSVLIKDYSTNNAIVLANEIIQQDVSGRSYVFVATKGNNGDAAKKVFVELGESYEGETEIKSGLTGNETIIARGARGLVDGEPIEIQ